MDSDSDVASSKRLKSCEDEDMISKLPDSIIANILSLVPVEDAVRTCVLSKRWINLWRFVTHLHFQDGERHIFGNKKEKQWFLNFVNGVMLNRNDSCIHNFALIIKQDYDPSYVNEWISAALRRRVKMLCVDSYQKKVNLPSYSFLQFQFLEELVLKVNYCAIKIPSSICLSSLTVLKLSGIAVNHHQEYSNNIGNLTLKFPVLREFYTEDCTWFGVDSVTLEVPLLQVAYITSRAYNSYGIKFCASRLTNFTYHGYASPHPCFLDLSAANIVLADIQLMTHHNPYDEEEFELNPLDLHNTLGELRSRACKLLKQFTGNVECLKFGWVDSVPEVPQVAKDSLADLPASKMLTHLEIDSVSVGFLLALLQKTPALKTLVFEVLLESDKELLNFAIVPDCIRSKLEVVIFLFPPDNSELLFSFAKFVMENANVLKRMRVYPANSDLEDVKEKLLSFKKASSEAIIECL